jgi:phage tail-like protein
MTLEEGGQNLYKQTLPTTIDHDNLILERGVVVGSLMNLEWNATMSLFLFAPSNCIVTLFNESSIPVAAWLFLRTYPVKWTTSDLNAEEQTVLIDTFELSYSSMQILRI